MPVESIKGRGATRNPTPARFNLQERLVEGDWLDSVEALDGVPKRRTTVTIEHPKSILTRNRSPDIGFDRSVNAYRGCEHGCIYCFARPTHAYHDLSPGVDFESRLFVKPNAAQLLHATLSRPGYECAPIAMGTNTDPYQPIEERWRITRSIIELLVETRHPFTITTKSDRVLRDLDLLKPAAELGIVSVALSAAATMIPTSSAGCRVRVRGRTLSGPALRRRPLATACSDRSSAFAATCSNLPKAISFAFFDGVPHAFYRSAW